MFKLDRPRLSHSKSLVAFALAFCATASACSIDGSTAADNSSRGTQPSSTSAAAKLVPDAYRGKQVTAVALQDYPPAGYVENGKWVGIMVDLNEAIAAELGLDIKLEPSSFDVIIPGLQAKRWDIGMPSMAVSDERRKVLDFITVFQAGTGFILPASSEKTISSGDDLCGMAAGALKGSAQVTFVDELSAACETNGKPGISMQVFPSDDQGALALASERVQVYATGSDTFAVLAPEGNGKLVAQPFIYKPYPSAIGMPKGSDLSPAILQAVKDIIADGTYEEIFKKYKSESIMLTDPPELLE